MEKVTRSFKNLYHGPGASEESSRESALDEALSRPTGTGNSGKTHGTALPVPQRN